MHRSEPRWLTLAIHEVSTAGDRGCRMGWVAEGDHITEGLTFVFDGFVGFPQLRMERKAEGVTSKEGQQSVQRESLI